MSQRKKSSTKKEQEQEDLEFVQDTEYVPEDINEVDPDDIIPETAAENEMEVEATAAPRNLHFDQALESGFLITSYQLHDKNQNYTVHVRKDEQKGQMVKTFSNISPEHLASALGAGVSDLGQGGHEVGTESQEPTSTAHIGRGALLPKGLHFASAIENGYKITSYKKHDKNDRYSVHVKKGDEEKVFVNITPEHLAIELGIPLSNLGDINKVALPKARVLPEPTSATVSTPTSPQKPRASHKPAGLHFANAIQSGFKIASYKKHDANDNYTVQVKNDTGEEYVFTNITPTHLTLGLDLPASKLVHTWEAEHHEPHLSFGQAIKDNWMIVGYKKHDSNNQYSVWVERNDLHKTFTRISPEHLAEALKMDPAQLQASWGQSEKTQEKGKLSKCKQLLIRYK